MRKHTSVGSNISSECDRSVVVDCRLRVFTHRFQGPKSRLLSPLSTPTSLLLTRAMSIPTDLSREIECLYRQIRRNEDMISTNWRIISSSREDKDRVLGDGQGTSIRDLFRDVQRRRLILYQRAGE